MLIKIILSFIFLITWILIQYTAIQIIMDKVSDSTIRKEIIIFLFVIEIITFIYGLSFGLIWFKIF